MDASKVTKDQVLFYLKRRQRSIEVPETSPEEMARKGMSYETRLRLTKEEAEKRQDAEVEIACFERALQIVQQASW